MHARTPSAIGLVTGLVVALASAPIALAQGTSASAHQDAAVTYVPPIRGIPGKRISGATRGVQPDSNSAYERQRLRIFALAPDDVAMTMQEQPTLYWFASRAVPDGAELTLTDGNDQTVLDTTLRGPIPAGINPIKLAGTAAHLKVGQIYTWTVTAIVAPKDPMKNEVVSSQIERTATAKLAAMPPAGDANAAAAAYARAGLWYEAIDALSRGLQAAPNDKVLHRSRASLLAQVGLSAVAEGDSLAAR